jgi:hypothetical protein
MFARPLAALGAISVLALAPGCYDSHVRVDPSRCAPLGTHTVTQTIIASDPGCGMVGPVGTLPVTIPLTEATFMGAGDVEVVMTGPCTWTVHAETLIPDFSSELDGTVDTSDGTVRGSFSISVSGFTGMVCRSQLTWSEAP